MNAKTKILLIVVAVVFFGWYIKHQQPVVTQTKTQPYPTYLIEGGKKQDQIASIDEPVFITYDQAKKWLKDDEEGASIELSGVNRFYPMQIMTRHEIVNDMIKGKRVLVIYSPLSDSFAVFDPTVKDKTVEFGVTGKVWNSLSVYYDRYTKSYWDPVRGISFWGDATGSTLAQIPSERTTVGLWHKLNPKGEILSRYTKKFYEYENNPYAAYDTSPQVIFPYAPHDERLKAKEYVYGVVIDGKATAFPITELRKNSITDGRGTSTVKIQYNKQLKTHQFYRGSKRIPSFFGFWFAWSAMYPKTEVYLNTK